MDASMDESMDETQIEWEQLVEKWPSPFVSRAQVHAFSGGLISAGTMANEDSRGTGPEGRFTANGRTMYHTKKLVPWLKQRAKRPARRKVKRSN